MKKSILLLICVFAFSALQAQWVDDPTANTRLATASDDAGEIYLATHEATGDTYIQIPKSNRIKIKNVKTTIL